ncbi:hypothetical protein E2C01_045781 [Portunus trituberculatus]|uniref:Uncharacterized protein n=1 Tax=Portunus trituberculatus TaxID=210409 RepID=A0A5B7G5Y1_PORTR|nr:hypothetical protein [Portunus trituberculatus]
MCLVQILLNQQWDRQSRTDNHPVRWAPSSHRDLEWWLEDQNLAQSRSFLFGYKAMLNSILAIRGLDLNNDQVLRLIIRACSSQPQRPTRDLRPSWNLDVVFCYLTKAPFEPLQLSSTRDLTRKTFSACSHYSTVGRRDPSTLSQDELAGTGFAGLLSS